MITGATGGLGRVVSHAFVQAGTRLVLVGRTLEKLVELEQELNSSPDKILSYPANLTQPNAVASLKEAVWQSLVRWTSCYTLWVDGWVANP